MELRPYQKQLIDNINARWKAGDRRVLAQLPTGAGKTVCFSELARQFLDVGESVLILAHRKELIIQAKDKLEAITGLPCGVIKAGYPVSEIFPIQVASVQSLIRRKRFPAAGLIIVDEAHHSISKTYMDIMAAYADSKILGVTATPCRSDGQGFKYLFDSLVVGVSPGQLIEDGYLSKFRVFRSSSKIDTKGIRKVGGDYNQGQLEDAARKITGDLVTTYQKYAEGKSNLVFAVSIEHSKEIVQAFKAAGISAEHVDGETDDLERDRIFNRFRSKETMVLSNVNVATEGTDIPQIESIQVARPTMSLILHLQMCLDLETEVLTHHGFRKYSEIKQWHKIAAYDRNTDEIKWTYAQEYIHRPLTPGEKMVSVSSPSLDIRVTDGHNMVWRSRGSEKSWQLSPAKDLASRYDGYEIPISGFLKTSGLPLADDEIRFLGWFLTDGSINLKSGQVNIYQSGHQPWLQRIFDCLQGCGFKFGVDIRQCATNFGEYERYQFYVSKGKPRATDTHLRGWGSLAKYLNKNLCRAYDAISRDQLAVLLEELHYGDGTKMEGQSWTRRSYHISTGNKLFANNLQRLCVTRGFKCNIAESDQNGDKLLYLLHIKDTQTRYIGGVACGDRPILKNCEFSSDEWVWCLQNRYGTLVTRRNGKVAIVGNCGRGLRPSPGKEHCVIIDHSDNWLKHGLPDEDREWTLEPVSLKPARFTQSCLECHHVFVPRSHEQKPYRQTVDALGQVKNILRATCPACLHSFEWEQGEGGEGVEPGEGIAIAQERGEIEELDLTLTPKHKDIIDNVAAIAKQKGYKSKWIAMYIIETYGEDAKRFTHGDIRYLARECKMSFDVATNNFKEKLATIAPPPSLGFPTIGFNEEVDKLLAIQAEKGYKTGWTFYRLTETLTFEPSVADWLYVAEKLQYPKEWAYRKKIEFSLK